eukprot:jgi/Ulvmu1/1593/UM111_0021.1
MTSRGGGRELFSNVYKVVERFMPWRYTGIFSHPEFKNHELVVGQWRQAPANPPFEPIVESVASGDILDPKKYKKVAARNELVKDIELSDADIKKMQSWQEETPMGAARFRFKHNRGYVYDYEDNGYR